MKWLCQQNDMLPSFLLEIACMNGIDGKKLHPLLNPLRGTRIAGIDNAKSGPWEVFTTQLFSLFITYKRPNKLECYITLDIRALPKDKHSSLLGPFKSYKDNEGLWVGIQKS